MTARVPTLAGVLTAALLAAGCGFERSTNVVVPTAPSAAPPSGGGGTTPTPAPSPAGSTPLVGMWISNEVNLPSPTSCGFFQYQITSQTANSIAGTFTAQCGAGLSISGSASGQVNGNATSLTITGQGTLPGLPACPFSLTSNGTIENNGNTLRLPYSGTTCLGPVSGTEVLNRPAPAAAQPPLAPAPPPAPAPAPAPPSVPEGFDLNQVTIVGGSPDVRGWPITSEITSLVFSPGTLHIDHTKRGRWPAVDIGGALQESTIWVFEKINGRWYGTGGERVREYQVDKPLSSPSAIGNGWFYSNYWAPMNGYVARPGEVVGFMMVAGSTRADFNAPVRERSGVVLINFPADGQTVGYPPFLWRE